MGRNKKSVFDQFQAMAWFNTIASAVGDNSPRRLERLFQPELLKRNEAGRLNDSRAWHKYRKGKRVPSDGYRPDGTPRAVISAAGVPGALAIVRHPIWKFLQAKNVGFDAVVETISSFPYCVSRYYIDLTSGSTDRLFESFAENIGRPIWIDADDDYDHTLDHLTAHLMILKMDNFRHTREHHSVIAENVAKTLGPIASSAAFNPMYEDFFDALEQRVWGGLFEQHYHTGSSMTLGWRRSLPHWV